ncbi:MAG TPA: sulfatase-like hydrolase/transferase [Solirubrobacteraceae bacterium]
MSRAPNVLVVITDQQRAPRHWPDEPGWVDALMPADAELRRTGLSFTEATCNSCMCTPSRATLLTGLMPAEHGCPLTLTAGGAKPHLANVPAVLADAPRDIGIPRQRALRNLVRMLTGVGAGHGPEPELDPAKPNLATLLRARGYEVAYKGKWHLTRPLAGAWGPADARRLASDYGFAGWEPPDAGEDIQPEHFGGGTANWDEAFTAQAEAYLASEDLEEPFALVVSLVNPHDVLAYPATYDHGGYRAADWADLEVGLPPTVGEDLRTKPTAHRLLSVGLGLLLGPLRDDDARRAYVGFYAHLQRLVDRHVGRLVAALGDPGDPASLRSRTIVVRLSDHGEMGLAHGGIRQKAFNAYEESLRVPLVFSNPVLFPRAAETPAPASLIDVLPTLLALAGAPAELTGTDLTPVLARHAAPDGDALRRCPVDLRPVNEHPARRTRCRT